MPGHSMGTLWSWEFLCKTQKQWGRGGGNLWECPPRKSWNFCAPRPGQFLGYYKPVPLHWIWTTSTMPLYRCVRGVKSLYYLRQTSVQWDQRSIRDFVNLRIQIAILRCELYAPDLRSTTVLSALIICRHACTGGVQPQVARACAPVCPSLAMPLSALCADLNMHHNTWQQRHHHDINTL